MKRPNPLATAAIYLTFMAVVLAVSKAFPEADPIYLLRSMLESKEEVNIGKSGRVIVGNSVAAALSDAFEADDYTINGLLPNEIFKVIQDYCGEYKTIYWPISPHDQLTHNRMARPKFFPKGIGDINTLRIHIRTTMEREAAKRAAKSVMDVSLKKIKPKEDLEDEIRKAMPLADRHGIAFLLRSAQHGSDHIDFRFFEKAAEEYNIVYILSPILKLQRGDVGDSPMARDIYAILDMYQQTYDAIRISELDIIDLDKKIKIGKNEFIDFVHFRCPNPEVEDLLRSEVEQRERFEKQKSRSR